LWLSIRHPPLSYGGSWPADKPGWRPKTAGPAGKKAGFRPANQTFCLAFSFSESLITLAFGVFSRVFEARWGSYRTQFSFPFLEESAMAKKSGSKPMTKTEIMRSISETTGLQKKDVVAVMEALTHEITRALKGSGIGVFSIPGLVKIERRKVPARPAQKGVKNPFTGELQDRPAKPASVKVRVRALKNLKAMVSG
jgi:nucleoid DNA-binding protein